MGGGIYLGYKSKNVEVTNNQIVGNHAVKKGGGIYVIDSSPIIANNHFERNTADISSRAIFEEGNIDVVVKDNVFVGNTPDQFQGGYHGQDQKLSCL